MTVTLSLVLAVLGAAGCGGPADGTGSTKTRPDSAAVSAPTSAAATPLTADPTAAAPMTEPAVAPSAAADTGSAEAAAAVTPLEGTAWAGTDSDGDAYVYRFNPAGQYGFTSPSGTYNDSSDTWSQTGDQVTMSTSGGYSTYHGTIVGDSISGTASNIRGHSWTWTATRQ